MAQLVTPAPWQPAGNSASMSLTTTSSNSQIFQGTPNAPTLRVCNRGANDAYVLMGGSSVTVSSTTGTLVPSNGGCIPLAVGTNQYVAGIAAASTTTLSAQPGAGTIAGNSGGVGSGGGCSALAGDVTGTCAATVVNAAPASGITGATLAAGVTASSLTSVGTLTSLGVAGAVTTTTADSTTGLFVKGATNLLRIQPQAGGLAIESTTLNQGAFAQLALNGSATIIQTGGTSALSFDASQNATFGAAMTNTHITTGTNADFLCLSAGGLFLLQTTACTISSMRFKNWAASHHPRHPASPTKAILTALPSR